MTAATETTTEVKVPDIGDFNDVPVIEVHVKPGDAVNADDPLVTLESDKATMDVPSPAGGAVADVLVKVGDMVSEGTPILMLQPGDGAMTAPPSLVEQQEPPPGRPTRSARDSAGGSDSPSYPGRLRPARRVDLMWRVRTQAPACAAWPGSSTSTSGRSPAQDRRAGSPRTICWASCADRRQAPAAAAPATGTGIPEIPAQDFSKFGPVETKALARIKKLSGPFLHRSWLNVPHVTHNDEADITDLDKYRKELDTAAKADGLSGDAAGVPGEGLRVGVEAVPRVQQFPVAGEGQPDPQEVLQHRHRGRHSRGAGGPGRERRRPQRDHRAVQRVRGHLEESPGRQAVPG